MVHTIFYVLENILDENKIINPRIFKTDETLLTVVQHPEQIIARKGKHQVGVISSCEQGRNVSSVYAVSATGFCVRPMLIYPRKRMKNNLSCGAILAIYSVVKAKAGWILKCSVNRSVISSQL
jgi:hypothetical protein